MWREFPICTGDPKAHSSSYTRFLLPFAYSLQQKKGEEEVEGSPTWRPDESAAGGDDEFFIERYNYLTPETATSLFHRASWWELQDEEGRAWGHGRSLQHFHREGRKIEVAFSTPRLVLFESPRFSSPGGAEKRSRFPCRENSWNGSPASPLQIGFLILEAWFPEGVEVFLDDFLWFNESFRYWNRPYPAHSSNIRTFLQQFSDCFDLAGKVEKRQTMEGERGESSHDADILLYLERWSRCLEMPLESREGVRFELFPERWADRARKWLLGDRRGESEPGWAIHSDFRTFVWTCAILDDLPNRFRRMRREGAEKDSLRVSDSGIWIKLLNVDPPGERASETEGGITPFEQQWVTDRTYTRWEMDGTFYGFTPHSGAMFSSFCEEPPLWRHFGGMYFDQVLLLLYLRTGTFHFSRRLHETSQKALDLCHQEVDLSRSQRRRSVEAWRHDFSELHRDFVFFTNLYRFPHLSSQQQAVEMYTIARQVMDVEEFFREVDIEIRNTHDYFEQVSAQEQTALSTKLTAVATGGLVIALGAGFLGMNVCVESCVTEVSSFTAGVSPSLPTAGGTPGLRLPADFPEWVVFGGWFLASLLLVLFIVLVKDWVIGVFDHFEWCVQELRRWEEDRKGGG